MLLSTHRIGHTPDNAKRFLIHVDVWIIIILILHLSVRDRVRA